MVYDSSCITKVEVIPNVSRIELPMVNGEPDKKHPTSTAFRVTYDPKCPHAHIEIRKDSNAVAPSRNP